MKNRWAFEAIDFVIVVITVGWVLIVLWSLFGLTNEAWATLGAYQP